MLFNMLTFPSTAPLKVPVSEPLVGARNPSPLQPPSGLLDLEVNREEPVPSGPNNPLVTRVLSSLVGSVNPSPLPSPSGLLDLEVNREETVPCGPKFPWLPSGFSAPWSVL